MSIFVITILAIHLFFLLSGLAIQHYGFMQFIRKTPQYKRIQKVSWFAFIFFIISTIAGWMYYSQYYKTEVQPLILSGDFPWIHNLLVKPETYLFVLIPLSSFVFVRLIQNIQKAEDERLKKTAFFVPLITLSLGALVSGTWILVLGII